VSDVSPSIGLRVCFVHVVCAITTGACAQRAHTWTLHAPRTDEVGVNERRSKQVKKDRENRENRERWNNRKVVKRGCCGRQVEKSERAGSTEKARSGSFKPASTTRDFAMYVLCRVDTKRDILTRQTAIVARRVGISSGWYVYD